MKKETQKPRMTVKDLKPGMLKTYGLKKSYFDEVTIEKNEDGEEVEKTVTKEKWDIIEDPNGVFSMRNITPRMSVEYHNVLRQIARDGGMVDVERFMGLWNMIYCGTEKEIPYEFMEIILGHHYTRSTKVQDIDRFFLTST